ncbi:uncharacterized protein LOC116342972 [Contarinia nasturtii]|uniref:uncharacterized protein LOC116342972 n=1 Tax=Contarinia nasturtii TaxID=265458 RepID=UPI0012D4BCC1|nr:uncharacterized protein LOC116342972 [Contarinia nasturtii]XP_031626676.1 uncharacterized protein LOC116342972 [Contarinia nasturtii]
MNGVNSRNLLGFLTTILIVLCNYVKMETCDFNELVSCTRPLSEISEFSGLSFLSKKSDLDKLCPDLLAGLECIQSYTRRCMNQDQRNHFNQLYHGTGEVIHELCDKDSKYQEDFLRHAPCLLHVQNKYEECSKHYQDTLAKLPEPSPNTTHKALEEVCCSFREYISCTEHIVKHTCGKEAAHFTRNILDRISNSLMRLHCEKFKPKPGKCGEPYYSHSSTIHLTTTALLFSVFVFLFSVPHNFIRKIF